MGRLTTAAVVAAVACHLLPIPLGVLVCGGGQQLRGRSSSVARLPARVGDVRLAALGQSLELVVGDKVKARSVQDEKWYPGRIDAQNLDGTWAVAWDDPDGGPETESVPADGIRKRSVYRDYKVGDDCKAISPHDSRWYPGVIAELLGDDKFRVEWEYIDLPERTADVHVDSMKRGMAMRDYQSGDKVIALSDEDDNWYEATVVRRNQDGTFLVRWDDPGDDAEEETVHPKAMRIPWSSLKIGQKHAGVVKAVCSYGAFIDIGAPVEGLLPTTLISKTKVSDANERLEEDQDVTVWIKGLSDDGRLSFTGVEGMMKEPETLENLAAFANLPFDSWHNGKVVSFQTYGAFVEVTLAGGEQAVGLVKKKDIRDDFVESVEQELTLGQNVQVTIKNLDLKRGNMELSMKRPEMQDVSPFADISQQRWLDGEVSSLTSYGAFVLITLDSGEQATGLVHVKRMGPGFVERVEDEVSVGQKVKVRIHEVDPVAGRIDLSMVDFDGVSDKSTKRQERHEVAPFADISPQRWLDGEVSGVTAFGAFVLVTLDSGEQATGLVHVKQMGRGFVERVEDEVSVGQKVKVRIHKVDLDAGSIALSMMDDGEDDGRLGLQPHEPVRGQSGGDPFWLTSWLGVDPSLWLMGVVISAAGYGVRVKVKSPVEKGPEVRGFVHQSEMNEGEFFVVGQQVRVRVHEVDTVLRSVRFTMRPDEHGGSVASRPPAAPSCRVADVGAFLRFDPAQWVTGTVNSVWQHGALVALAALDSEGMFNGILNLDEISDDLVESVEDELEVGQKVRVRIVDVDVQRREVRLSMRSETSAPASSSRAGLMPSWGDPSPVTLQTTPPPGGERATAFGKLRVGQKLTGVVDSVQDSKVIVDIGDDLKGHCPAWRIPKDLATDLSKNFRVGQEVTVWVQYLSDDGKFVITFSMVKRQARKPTYSDSSDVLAPFAKLSPHDWQQGIVHRLKKRHALVTVTLDDGHQARGHLANEHMTEKVKRMDWIRVRITRVGKGPDAKERMDLSMIPEQSGAADSDPVFKF